MKKGAIDPILGAIDPILKARIDRIQHRIDLIDDKYALNKEYRLSYLAVRDALVAHKRMLVEQI